MQDTKTQYNDNSVVLVALSGGVDSAVTVRILQEQGFKVQGAVIQFSSAHQKAVAAAQLAAKELDILLHVIDGQALFEKEVITPFCQMYASGCTPSPCLLCNPTVKFHLLCQKADELGIYFIASGHYANCEEKNGHFWIAKAESAKRDQSYMLYRLPQTILERLCLPLGHFEKTLIREMAKERGLSSAKAPDSQEICFIPNGDYASYIESRGISGKQGRFIGPDGQDLGCHRGVMHYTVGQRKGLGIALGEVVFVRQITEDGNVLLARAGEEYSSEIELWKVHCGHTEPFCAGQRYEVKIRSAAKPVPCQITQVNNESLCITFDCPQRAAAPGQHAVLYQNQYVVGGGEIKHSF